MSKEIICIWTFCHFAATAQIESADNQYIIDSRSAFLQTVFEDPSADLTPYIESLYSYLAQPINLNQNPF